MNKRLEKVIENCRRGGDTDVELIIPMEILRRGIEIRVAGTAYRICAEVIKPGEDTPVGEEELDFYYMEAGKKHYINPAPKRGKHPTSPESVAYWLCLVLGLDRYIE